MSKELVGKVAKIQSQLKAPKSQYNKFGQYAYRNQEDILEAVKPLLAAANLVQTITDDIVSVGGRIYVKSTVTVTDGEQFLVNSAFAREPEEQKGMSSAQVTGSTSSYARKYALNGMYAIDDTKDADATNTHGKETPAENKQVAGFASKNVPNETKAEAPKEAPKSGGRFAPKGTKPAQINDDPKEAKSPPVEQDGWN